MEKSLTDIIETLIGDTPISEQLGAALKYMAEKDHTHDNYVTRQEFEPIVRQLELLLGLVGDVSVSEQIAAALNNGKGG